MRVMLDTPTEHDAEAFIQSVSRSRELHGSFVTPPSNKPAYAAYLASLNDVRKAGFLVRAKDDRSLVGMVTVSEICRGNFQSAYLGYYAFAPFNGRGLMREGVVLVLEHCFETLRLHRIEANIQLENSRSRSLVRGLGFRREGLSPRYLKIAGVWRDHERWAILVEEWRQQSAATKRQ